VSVSWIRYYVYAAVLILCLYFYGFFIVLWRPTGITSTLDYTAMDQFLMLSIGVSQAHDLTVIMQWPERQNLICCIMIVDCGFSSVLYQVIQIKISPFPTLEPHIGRFQDASKRICKALWMKLVDFCYSLRLVFSFRRHYVKTGSAVMGSLLGLKWPIREPAHSPRFSADVKSSLRGTSIHFLSTLSFFHIWAWNNFVFIFIAPSGISTTCT
jgi:hypothetical protein